jgi:glycosyltransferase involved in cell wall biosynthesis
VTPPNEFPFVSVAVPTRNRADLLDGCIGSLIDQHYPNDRYEIVVVDDGSRDTTPVVVRKAARRLAQPAVRYVAQRHRGPNAARNAALRTAVGDPVCFVDDDVDAPPEWLGKIVTAALGHPTAGCLGGPIHTRLDAIPAHMRAREPLGEAGFDLGCPSREVRYVWSGNFAVRRHAVEAVGPFQEHRLPGHDEIEWIDRLYRAHIPVFYVADARVWHRRHAQDLKLSKIVPRRFVRGVGESVAYHRAGVAYRVHAQVHGLREQLHHAVLDRRAEGLAAAAQFAGRLVGLGPLRLWDRIRGRRGPLPPPPG